MNVSDWIAICAVVIPIIGAIIVHVIRDHGIQSRHDAEISRIKEDIGTHDSGMRGQVHEHARFIGRLQGVVYFIGQKLKLDVMKDIDDDK